MSSIFFQHSNMLTRASHHWCIASNIVLVSPLISRSACAGSLSYMSTRLRHAVGDGKTSSWFPLLCLRYTLLWIRRLRNFQHGLLDCSVVAPCATLSSAAIVPKPPHRGLWNSLECKLARTKLGKCARLLSQMCMGESMCGKGAVLVFTAQLKKSSLTPGFPISDRSARVPYNQSFHYFHSYINCILTTI